MKFTIPLIIWDKVHTKYVSQNTFVEYVIHECGGCYRCYYGNGRYKEFATLDETCNWVEVVHYPAQVKKYFVECE